MEIKQNKYLFQCYAKIKVFFMDAKKNNNRSRKANCKTYNYKCRRRRDSFHIRGQQQQRRRNGRRFAYEKKYRFGKIKYTCIYSVFLYKTKYNTF